MRFLDAGFGGVKLGLDSCEPILVTQFGHQINADILAIPSVSFGPVAPGPDSVILLNLNRIIQEESKCKAFEVGALFAFGDSGIAVGLKDSIDGCHEHP